MPDDYEDTVIIQGMYNGNLVTIAVDADGNLQAVLLGDSGGTPTQISLDADGKIEALLYGVYAGNAIPVAVDSNGRLTVSSFDQANINPDANEYQTKDSPIVTLVSNLNRIRWHIVQITGEAWGTVSHSVSTLWAKFNASTGHKHSGAANDGAQIDYSYLSGTPTIDLTPYTKIDGTRAFTGDQSMGSHKLTNLAAPVGDNDAARKIDCVSGGTAWADWTPTLNWGGGGTPGSITRVSRYMQVAKLVIFYLYLYSADSNACTTLTATLPVTPKNVSANIPIVCSENTGSGSAYQSRYPPEQSDTYVKATSTYVYLYNPYYATDPTKSLTGGIEYGGWASQGGQATNQRFHIDLGTAIIITRLYYENGHQSGTETDRGLKNFTLWGSNSATAFADLVYSHDTGWTQLTTSASVFDQHTGSDTTDPKYITVTNSTSYRYYAIKIADNYGDTLLMTVRRLELQSYNYFGVSDPFAYIKADGSDNKINFLGFASGQDGSAITLLVSGQYEVD